ncbi:uncharacterized protein METZ01_LOCUS142380, partial [marine metagenome]
MAGFSQEKLRRSRSLSLRLQSLCNG